MLSFALTVALAAPCGIPHKHKHHAPEPVQTCATPVVPMCFKAPEPDIELLPFAAPLIYYQISDATAPAAETLQSEPSTYVYGGGYYAPVGGIPPTTVDLPPTPPGGSGYMPPRAPPAHAPEIDSASAAGALTLLIGGVALLTGRKS